MQVPKRKSENYPREKLDPHMTQQKLNELKEKLKKLKLSHPHAAAEVQRLAKMGDFSENFAYQMAKGRLRSINQRILELEDQIKNAIIIQPNKDSGVISLGSKVTVETMGRKITFLILGSAETNPAKGIISQNSPVGAALLGCKVGDIIKIFLANKEISYKILKIE